MSHLIKNGFMKNYQYWNKHEEERLNKAEMRYLYLEKKVPAGVKEDHDDVNETDIL
jgi:predicted negative regulator of RcsB-dependent stress response